MSQGFVWENALSKEEQWLNSDREILNRVGMEPQDDGNTLLTIELPDGETFGCAVDKLNAESGAQFCDITRRFYDESKTEKTVESSRRHAAREQQAILDRSGNDARAADKAGGELVQEAVQALAGGVSGLASLEESIVSRIDAAASERQACSDRISELDRELTQLKQMKEIMDASKVLEATSNSIQEPEQEGPETAMVDAAPSPSNESVSD